jgi:hypothetical protein
MGMSSGPDRAQRQAEANERERLAEITRGTAAVNDIYSNPAREAQIGDVISATRESYMRDLEKQKGDTDRQLKFALARSGTSGGSNEIFQGKRVGEEYVKGKLLAENRAQGVGADLRQSDQASKQNLLAMIQGGLDMGTAQMQANSALSNNLMSARSGAGVEQLGDVFGTFADLFRKSQENKARRDAERYAYNTIYQSGPWSFNGGRR